LEISVVVVLRMSDLGMTQMKVADSAETVVEVTEEL
jgi:hypothetical protein